MSVSSRRDAGLRYASEDLRAAEVFTEQETIPRQACFHAQQAAEKAIKGVLVFLQIEFPYRHDLDFLRNLLPDGWLLKEQPPDLAELTAWAIRGRYPGGWQEATEEDARTATDQAREVHETALEDLERYGYTQEDTA